MLLYHAVMDDPPGWIAEFTVTPAAFAAQLDAIEAGGRTAVPVGALVAHLAGGEPLPDRPVVLTFDAPPPAPTLTSVSPDSGPTAGGGSVVITGTDLTSAIRLSAMRMAAVRSSVAISSTQPAAGVLRPKTS